MVIKHIGMAAHPGGLTKLNIVVSGDRKEIGEMVMRANEDPDEKPWELEIHKQRKKRSLDANSYYWVLLTRLAQKLRTSNDELHEQMINDYGVVKLWSDGTKITFTLRAEIDPHEVAKYVKVVKTQTINGVEGITYAVMKGSSEMSTDEFSALLDGLISECKEQGIPTATPAELEQMKALMGGAA